MRGVFLGFSGRIGRLRFFLLSTGLGIATVIALIAIVLPMLSRGGASGLDGVRTPAVLIPLGLVVLVALWFSFALQAKRIRDIGWPPSLVIPAWIAADMLDRVLVLTGSVPALHGQSSTAVGALLNLVGGCVLLFWPGGEPDAWIPPARQPGPSLEPRPSPAPAPAAVRSTTGPVGFGRRGLR